jgi:hypothetical protein
VLPRVETPRVEDPSADDPCPPNKELLPPRVGPPPRVVLPRVEPPKGGASAKVKLSTLINLPEQGTHLQDSSRQYRRRGLCFLEWSHPEEGRLRG